MLTVPDKYALPETLLGSYSKLSEGGAGHGRLCFAYQPHFSRNLPIILCCRQARSLQLANETAWDLGNSDDSIVRAGAERRTENGEPTRQAGGTDWTPKIILLLSYEEGFQHFDLRTMVSFCKSSHIISSRSGTIWCDLLTARSLTNSRALIIPSGLPWNWQFARHTHSRAQIGPATVLMKNARPMDEPGRVSTCVVVWTYLIILSRVKLSLSN